MNSENVPSTGRRVTEYLQGAAVVFLLLLKALEVKMGKGDTQNQKEKSIHHDARDSGGKQGSQCPISGGCAGAPETKVTYISSGTRD